MSLQHYEEEEKRKNSGNVVEENKEGQAEKEEEYLLECMQKVNIKEDKENNQIK